MGGHVFVRDLTNWMAAPVRIDTQQQVPVQQQQQQQQRMLPPMVIIKKAILEKYFRNDLDNDTLLAMSETGFTNDQLAIEYIKHFEEHAKKPKHNQGCKRLLVIDGHGSHMTQE